jgi:hypothetical protein
MLPSSITDACNVSAQTGLTLRAPDMQEGFMAGEDGPRFEIPADMRALAEKSVEQAKQAFDIFISAAQHAVNTAETQAVNAHAGAKEMGELAIGFAERNIASSFAFAQKLLQAKVAYGLRQQPDRDAHRPGEGTEQACGQDGWPRHPALRPKSAFGAYIRRNVLLRRRVGMLLLCDAIFFIAMHQKLDYKYFIQSTARQKILAPGGIATARADCRG